LARDLEKPVVQDVAEPNLFRHMYPYRELPRVCFDGESPAMAPAEEIWVTDTTFRDGQQARPPYTVEQIVELYRLEQKLDGGAGLIRASEFFLYSRRDREAVEKCLELGYEFPKVTGWVLARPQELKLVKDMGLAETGILTSCSDYHIFLKLNKTRRQAMEMYLEVARAAVEDSLGIRCHFEDITRADFDGFVIPLAAALMELRAESGVEIKIRLCDTMGFGVPWAEATLPRSVPRIIHAMIHKAGVPGELLEWHGHNDFHKVLVNPATAWLYGCAACNGSLLGIGERTGNTPVEALVIEAAQLRGTDRRIRYEVITEIARYYRDVIGYEAPANFPLVGRDFNTTRAGIHTDGLIKSEEIYTAFDTQAILNRPIGVVITDKCGAAGIKHWIDNHYGLNIAKDDAHLVAVRERVEAEYETGRTTAISDEEMRVWCDEALKRE